MTAKLPGVINKAGFAIYLVVGMAAWGLFAAPALACKCIITVANMVCGTAKVINGDHEFFVNTNESTYIPAGHKHRLENPGLLNLVMIEVQSGGYLGEDDIVRFEDNYGRA